MSEISWVDWFLSQKFGKYFVKIDSQYLSESFNYYGLRQKVEHFKLAMDMIRGPYIPPDKRPEDWPRDIDHWAIMLYGLLHARYLLTQVAQQRVFEKYRRGDFERCPRVYCDGIYCLPYGTSEQPNEAKLKMFCPNCKEIYNITDCDCQSIDSAFFGPSWVHLFVQKYPSIVPSRPPKTYTPRIFGFKIAQKE